MNDYNAGQITRLCAGGQFVAATGITGAVDTHTQGDHTAEGLSQNGAAHKTKATPKDRQWHRTKPGQNSRYQAGGLEKIRHPQIEEAGECRQLATVGRVQKYTLPGCQPFGSMPSLRNFSLHESFTHALKLPFPAMDSICSSSGSSKRIIFLVLPERSCFDFSHSSCIGAYRHVNLLFMVCTILSAYAINSNAPKCSRTPRRLTTNVKHVTR